VSFVPPFAPMTMPPRIALGEASAVEIAGALAVTVGATALLIPLAARIYRGGVLRTGGAIQLRDAWRVARGARLRRDAAALGAGAVVVCCAVNGGHRAECGAARRSAQPRGVARIGLHRV